MIKFLKQHNCKEELKAFGLKATPARVAIVKYLENVKFPQDAEMIFKELEKTQAKADPATVYRILDVFYKKGLVQRIELGEGKFRYERSKKHHHHLICISCGKIENVSGEYLSSLQEKIKKEHDFLVESHSLEFYGLCRRCRELN